ncbi:MAG: circadian clock KaiB family protein [Desulfovermiculus sp.]
MRQYVFDLYIAGHTFRSQQAAQNMEDLCERYFPDNYLLNIIDVLDDPQAAEKEKIIATPTLVQRAPLSGRRIIGALSDRKAMLQALGLESLLPEDNGPA